MSLEVALGVLWLIACLTVLVVRVQEQPVLPTQWQDQTAADEVIANVGPIGTSARLASIRSSLRKQWQSFTKGCARLCPLGVSEAPPKGFDYFATRSVAVGGF